MSSLLCVRALCSPCFTIALCLGLAKSLRNKCYMLSRVMLSPDDNLVTACAGNLQWYYITAVSDSKVWELSIISAEYMHVQLMEFGSLSLCLGFCLGCRFSNRIRVMVNLYRSESIRTVANLHPSCSIQRSQDASSFT